ncbi:MAG: protein-tyrosine-phosphatase [Chitinophagales bacterium]
MTQALLAIVAQGNDDENLNDHRQHQLQPLIDYLVHKLSTKQMASILFVCTHNSRRSQFSQTWAQLSANHFNLPIQCFSGGTEVTACNPRTIDSLNRSGLDIDCKESGDDNPHYLVTCRDSTHPIELYSKRLDDPKNPVEHFAAVMTCDHADQNCPTILGADRRIPIRYEDPKAFDDSPQEAVMYDTRSRQIATEMHYIMQKTKEALSQGERQD